MLVRQNLYPYWAGVDILKAATGITSVVLIQLLLLGCWQQQPLEETNVTRQLPTVTTEQVVQSDHYQISREYVGSVRAGQKANLGFELSGKVSAIYADTGETVAKGQALIALDSQLLDSELKQLMAQQKEIQAQLKLTNASLSRQNALRKRGFSSESEIDVLVSKQQAFKANLSKLQASMESVKLRKQKSTIIAPYSGVVSQRFVSLGDVVSMGAPTLSLLSNDDSEVLIGVHRDDVKDIEASLQHSIRIGNAMYRAKLISQASNIDIHSRNVGLRFILEGKPKVLDGELAYLSYQKSIAEKGTWLPSSSLVDGVRGTWNIYTISKRNQQKIVDRRSVQVLFANNDTVYVQGAIAEGDEVITSGLQKIVVGQQVQVVN